MKSRRAFLRGAGGVALAIPFLPSVMGRTARASDGSPTKFIQCASFYSLPRSTTEPGYLDYERLTYHEDGAIPWQSLDADTRGRSLRTVVERFGSLSYVLNGRWNRHIDRLNVTQNLHGYFQTDLHNTSTAISASVHPDGYNRPGRPYSADWLVARKFQREAPSLIDTLRVNLMPDWVCCADKNLAMSYGVVDGETQTYEGAETLNHLLAELQGAAGPADAGAEVARRANEGRRQVLNAVLGDYRRLRDHARIDRADRVRLEQAVDQWADIERSIVAAPAPRSCSEFGAAPGGLNFREQHEVAMDMVVLALSCGLTRTVSYYVQHLGDSGLTDIHSVHGAGHDSRTHIDGKGLDEMARWRSDRIADLCDRLADTDDEFGRPLLESTILQFNHEYSTFGHEQLGFINVTVAGEGTGLRTGLQIDAGGAPVNRSHITNMMAAGLTLEDIELDGEAGFGQYLDPGEDGTSRDIWNHNDSWVNGHREYRYERVGHFLRDAERRKALPILS